MRPIEELPPVFFDHIHKTGGTSVQALLTIHYGSANVVRADCQTETALLEFEAYKVIAGHVTHTAGCWPFQKRYTFTLLRDPIARTLSSYYFFCRKAGNFRLPSHGGDRREDREISLDEFVRGEIQGTDVVLNFQARHFATLAVDASHDVLAAAKAALERYHLVGLQEQLDDTVRLLLADLDLPSESPVPFENVTPRYPGPDEIPPAIRREIEDRNALDLQLWAWAKDRFQTRLGEPPRRIIVLAQSSTPAIVKPTPRAEVSDVLLIGALLQADDGRRDRFATGERLTLTIAVWSAQDQPAVTVGFHLSTTTRRVVFGTNTHLLKQQVDLHARETIQVRFEFPMLLAPGHYSLGLSCHEGPDATKNVFLWRESVREFDISNAWLPGFAGMVWLPTNVDIAPLPTNTAIHWMPPLPPPQVRAGIDLLPPGTAASRRARPGQMIEIPIQVTNLCTHALAPFPPFPIAVAYHIKTSDGRVVVFDGRRTTLPAPIMPASHIEMVAFVSAPEQAGAYVIELSLVQEGRFWFEVASKDLPKAVELVVLDENLDSTA